MKKQKSLLSALVAFLIVFVMLPVSGSAHADEVTRSMTGLRANANPMGGRAVLQMTGDGYSPNFSILDASWDVGAPHNSCVRIVKSPLSWDSSTRSPVMTEPTGGQTVYGYLTVSKNPACDTEYVQENLKFDSVTPADISILIYGYAVTVTSVTPINTGTATPGVDIRYAATKNGGTTSTHSVTVNSGTSNKATAAAGEVVTVTAGAAPAGQEFERWSVDAGGVTLADPGAASTTFTMGSADVELTAIYKPIDYTVTVSGGTSNKATAHKGDTVTVTAGSAPAGQVFDKWRVDEGGVTLANPSAASTSFTMGAADVKLTALFKPVPTYNVTVNGGTSDKASAPEGQSVSVTAGTAPAGQEFDGWTVNSGGVTLADPTAASTTFTMGTANVELTAKYKPINYSVTVDGGTSNKATAHKGDTVTVTAGSAPAGQVFDKWRVDAGGVTLANTNAVSTSFTMGTADVKLTALFKPIPTHSVTVNSGTSSKATAAAGDTVQVTADVAPAGQEFERWSVDAGGVTLGDPSAATTTFTMGDSDVELTAKYKPINYSVTVNGGTSNKATATMGQSVTVTAGTAPAGQVFDKWRVDEGGVTLADPTAATTSFTMGTANVKVTALFKAIPAHTVTVNSGTSSKATAAAGDTVQVTADVAPAGQVFERWSVDAGGVTLADPGAASTTFAMGNSDVELTAIYKPIDYTVTVSGGTSNKATAHKGDTVTVTAGSAPAGQVFDKWRVDSGGVTLADPTAATTSFTMGTANVKVTALFKAIPAHTVTVNGGTSDVPSAASGRTVTVTADAAPAGQEFDEWTVNSGGVTLANSSAATTTFTMGDSDVELTAKYKPINYSVTVNGGTSNKATATMGQTVTVTAGAAPAGQEFDGWTVNSGGVSLANPSAATTTFTMGDSDVELTAKYKPINYSVTVDGGTSSKATANRGDEVTVTAGTAPAGQMFDKWRVDAGGVTLANANAASTSFTMGTADVKLTALFKPIPTHSVTVNSGTADKEVAISGETVKVTAGAAPAGQVFERWSVDAGGVTLGDPGAASTTFTMGNADVELTAIYKPMNYNVTVEGGTSNKATATMGQTVTVTAGSAPAGQVFDKWRVDEGGVTLADPSAASTTFTMGTADVKLTALFKPVPTYNVTVNGGTSDKASAPEGQSVTVTVGTAPDGQVFDKWRVDEGGVTLADPTAATTTFTMGTANVEVTAVFKALPAYAVTVTGGTSDVPSAASGRTVTVTADAAPDGQMFDKWRVDTGGVTLADPSAASTTFTMGDSDVRLTALFKPIPTYGVSVVGGTSDKDSAREGEVVTLTADAAPDGQVFDKWGVDAGGVTLADPTAATTTFTMGAADVKVTALFKAIPTYGVSVVGGTSDKDSAREGEVVTLTADAAPDGQVFDKWRVDAGGVTLADPTAATTTFTMGTSDVEVTALFKAQGGSDVTPDPGSDPGTTPTTPTVAPAVPAAQSASGLAKTGAKVSGVLLVSIVCALAGVGLYRARREYLPRH